MLSGEGSVVVSLIRKPNNKWLNCSESYKSPRININSPFLHLETVDLEDAQRLTNPEHDY